MSLIVVCGALANKPGNGGAAWTRLSWAARSETAGLRRLFRRADRRRARALMPQARLASSIASVNLAYFTHVTERFGLGDASALIAEDGRAQRRSGPGRARRHRRCRRSAREHQRTSHARPRSSARFRKRVFIDLDPGYTQFWHAAGLARRTPPRSSFLFHRRREHRHARLRDSDRVASQWRPDPQPVVLDEWPVSA